MLSMDLAELYGVEHRVLMQAIKCNINPVGALVARER